MFNVPTPKIRFNPSIIPFTHQRDMRVLLISDQTNIVTDIRNLLEADSQRPYCVYTCATLATALEGISNRSAGDDIGCDIILLDLDLTTGTPPREIFSTIAEVSKDIPVIILTGKGDIGHELAVHAIEAGAADHMVRGCYGRLTDAMKYAIIRRRNMTRVADANVRHLEEADVVSRTKAVATEVHSHRRLQAVHNAHAQRLAEKNQFIGWVTGSYAASAI